MNQLEQTRLHVLNSVLEHQLPVAQAAEILGVSNAMPGEFWRPIARRAPPHWPTGTEAADPATLLLTMRQPR